MNRTLYFLLLCLTGLTVPVWATNYYVANNGNDNNTGLDTLNAFLTIQRGVDAASAGDTVYVRAGLYQNAASWQDVVYINKSGTANAWITIRNFWDEQPIIQFNGWNGFRLDTNAAYIQISGFEIIGNNQNVTLQDAINQPAGCNDPNGNPLAIYNGNGITVDGREGVNNKPHHIRIVDNFIRDCGGAGIAAIHADYMQIYFNLIYDNCFYTIYGTSGISIWQPFNYDNNTSDYRNVIYGNFCRNNKLLVPWVYAPCAITDGNGITIDDTKNTQNGSTNGNYNGKTYVGRNYCWYNGGSGLHTYQSQNVDIYQNVAYHNSQSSDINNGEIYPSYSDNINIHNNILIGDSGQVLNTNYNNSNINYDFNVHNKMDNINTPLFGANCYYFANADTLFFENIPAYVEPFDFFFSCWGVYTPINSPLGMGNYSPTQTQGYNFFNATAYSNLVNINYGRPLLLMQQFGSEQNFIGAKICMSVEKTPNFNSNPILAVNPVENQQLQLLNLDNNRKKISIINYLGQVLYTADTNNNNIALPNLATGIYSLQIGQQQQTIIIK